MARLQGIQRAHESNENSGLFELEKELKTEYERILFQEELLWYQKSRCKWNLLGDRNTKYFHTKTIIWRRKNRIMALRDPNRAWWTDQEVLKEKVVEFFSEIYREMEDNSQNLIIYNRFPQNSNRRYPCLR